MSSSNAKIVSTETLSNKEAKWTRLVLTHYTDPLGNSRTWEHAERPTRPKGSDIDAVGIVAILQREGGEPEILLQKQFRPPVGKVCVEVPAGLVDAGESAEEAAVRELKEETGFVGTVLEGEGSGVMWNDPGFCTTNLKMVHVSIDLSRPENQDPKPQLEESEFIECFTLPLKGLLGECKRMEAEGFAIDARVATLAEGIEIARRWKL